MGRPRQFDPDTLIEHARRLWLERGASGVTLRGLSASTGASNGAIYHAFGSRDGLVARVWAREADRFLTFQRDRVEQALRHGDPTSAVVTASLAPAAYADASEEGARLLLSTNADQLMTPGLDAVSAEELRRLQRELGRLLVSLAEALWNRRDRAAVTTVRYCVVELPGTLLLKGHHVADPVAQHALEQAVRGIASKPPPPHSKEGPT